MTLDRSTATTLVCELAGTRGYIVGDTRSAGSAGGVYSHHNPTTGRAAGGRAASVAPPRSTPRSRPRLTRCRRLAGDAAGRADRGPVPPRRPARRARRRGGAINALDNGTPVARHATRARTPRRWTRYYAGWIDKLDGEVVPVVRATCSTTSLPEPYGVVGAIVPWNGPMMGMGQKAVPALAAGNTVVAKPPEIAPFGALRVRRARARSRAPAGRAERRRRRRGGRRGAGAPPRRRQGVVHRRRARPLAW